MRCNYVHRVQVHPSIKIGGVSIGRCCKERVPGLVVCQEHATKEALTMILKEVLGDYEKEVGEKHRYESTREEG